jgi:hypothetical protein
VFVGASKVPSVDLAKAEVVADCKIVNANGDKIEFFFVDTENNKGIMSTELKYPVTGTDITLVEESDGLDYLNLDIVTDENQNIGGESITSEGAVDVVGSLK